MKMIKEEQTIKEDTQYTLLWKTNRKEKENKKKSFEDWKKALKSLIGQ